MENVAGKSWRERDNFHQPCVTVASVANFIGVTTALGSVASSSPSPRIQRRHSLSLSRNGGQKSHHDGGGNTSTFRVRARL